MSHAALFHKMMDNEYFLKDASWTIKLYANPKLLLLALSLLYFCLILKIELILDLIFKIETWFSFHVHL